MTHSYENTAIGTAGHVQAASALRIRLKRANRAGSFKALALVAPLLLFLSVTFLLPIGLLLARAVDNREVAQVLSHTTEQLAGWDMRATPSDDVYEALVRDLQSASRDRVAEVSKRLNYHSPGFRTLMNRTVREAGNLTSENARAELLAINDKWGEVETWQIIKQASPALTDYYLLKAVDLAKMPDGDIVTAKDDAIYTDVIVRTVVISLCVTVLCVLIGYPLAYLLATTDPVYSRWLLMLVLLPFWTSLLVRTTAWLVLLQSNGVVNSLLSWLGLISQPLELVHNRVGVLIAMTHILLPFVVLPVHAVMKGIPDVYWRAASSLGAPAHKAFLRVYLPLTMPGVGAGALLVFILALGYYITPALVGGPKDQMLSYFIAYFVNQSSNWGMAAALAVVLLTLVVGLYLALVLAYGRSRAGAKP
ncbi:probable permease of ABC transporter (plasmid) [Sinorhizobium fredii NGR234]|uniref:Probable permease of ABC transporter n=1 Tax=Sinorhizobium fredii (strain NBRC 101917 / NGR234) TaxID=394 RepID=Q6W205_SINFN|nr:ABC transporter permease [Sinorhizobium fredii]AAQ87213.1 Spermidine/putrescine transport system permease protein potB [Sinorhizobium fredii NGR234]ACP23108.1 probable permease of ABC transporter [Sinorhizobium fredii NGR234]